MLKIDRQKRSFTVLEMPTLAKVSISEPPASGNTSAMARKCSLKRSARRGSYRAKKSSRPMTLGTALTILALVPQGHAVISRLSRGAAKLALLQALCYGGMRAPWALERF